MRYLILIKLKGYYLFIINKDLSYIQEDCKNESDKDVIYLLFLWVFCGLYLVYFLCRKVLEGLISSKVYPL